jgi:Ring finger domain
MQQQPTQSELRSTLATIIECPICCEMFTTTVRKPKLMTPCGHTLCLECGLTYCRHKSVSNAGERIACPVCRRGVRLPVGGFPALANNLTMMKLLDVRDILIRCDSESEVRSAVDMLEGLLACENKYA